METIKLICTNGLMATHENYARPFLAKVWFDVKSDDTVHVTVESARNGSKMVKIAKKIITRDELRNMPENPYDNMVFNRAAFNLMGLK